MGEEAWQLFAGLHRLLLRLAGRVPDEWLTYARGLLGAGDVRELPDTVAGAAAQLGVPLRAAELDVLRSGLRIYGFDRDPMRTAELTISDDTPPTGHRFAPVSPEVLAVAGGRIPASLDLAGGDPDDPTDLPEPLAHLADLADDLTDPTDDGPFVTLSEEPGVLAVWRAWRFGPAGPPADAQRVYLAEVGPDVRAWDLTHDTQQDLLRNGVEFPQVEVFWAGDELTPYHRAALAHSARLWVRRTAA
jgi:hypothetical protein